MVPNDLPLVFANEGELEYPCVKIVKMALVVVKERVTESDIKKAAEDYGEYIKITADIGKGVIAIGGEWHADGEKVLLENGSRQSDIWGGGIDLNTKKIDVSSLINIKPGINESMEILDVKNRDRFIQILKEKFKI